jgi:ring-1,2-phenylacetyl-CoA epoxidase subunit PaaE
MQEQITNLINLITSNFPTIITSIATTLGLLGLVYLIIWVIFAKRLAKYKIQSSRRAGFSQIKDETINTIIVIVVNGFFTGFILYLANNGYTQFYTETGKYGIWYEIFSAFVLLLIGDAWFYWMHRLLHHPKIYKYIHAVHHKSLDTNPFTVNSFHVLEGFLLTIYIIPALMIMPVSLLALGVNQVLGMYNNIKSHLGYEFYPKFFDKIFPLNMLVNSTNHNLHHTRYNGNYGLFFRHWDIINGTEIKETQDIFKSIHDRDPKNIKIIDNTKYQSLTISKIVSETADTTSVYFEPTNTDFYNYQAGQYINIRVKLNGQNCDRTFSLSSSPLDKFLRITVRLNGEVSHFFKNKARVGDKIEALLPVGDFGIVTNSNNQKNYLMIAGGSGITPLYSMIKTILNQEPKSKITLFYSNRTLESTIFANEIIELSNNFLGKFTVKNFVNGKRLGQSDITDYVSINNDFECYICGPESLKTASKLYLKNQNVDQKKIHTEDFVDGYVPWFGIGQNQKPKLVTA